MKELCAAVQEAEPYLQRFTRREYSGAFREYTERFSPLYLAAVQETAGADEALSALADGILDGLEEGWRRQRFWNRTVVRMNEKQMLVAYLSPMLLEQEEPLCQALAERLRDGWAARWPKDAYSIASHKELRGGFRRVILGITLPKERSDQEE